MDFVGGPAFLDTRLLWGVVLALIGVGFWVGGIVAAELIRRRIMEGDDDTPG